MRLSESFTAADLPTSTSGEPVPAGWYVAKITETELKKTKVMTGEYISLRFDIIGPTHQGRAVWGNLNISNPSAKAEQIGRQQLGELMRAIGLAKIEDTDQLVGGTCEIKIDIQAGDGQYAPRNEIKSFRAVSGQSGSASDRSAEPRIVPRAAPPWVKK